VRAGVLRIAKRADPRWGEILHSIDPGFGYQGWQPLEFPDVFLIEVDAARSAFSWLRP
jgi:hypothetical protein